jgi:hypothetical protein
MDILFFLILKVVIPGIPGYGFSEAAHRKGEQIIGKWEGIGKWLASVAT